MTFLTSAAGNRGILPAEYSELITKPITEQALPFRPELASMLTTNKHEIIIPTVETDAAAQWVAEGAEINPDDPTLSETKIQFAKVAALTVVSSEMAKDSSPEAQKIIGDSITRSMIARINEAYIRDMPAPAPKGLLSLTTANAVSTDTSLANLDIFTEAYGMALSFGRNLTGWLVNPTDRTTIARLKDQAGSNRKLLENPNIIEGLPVFPNHNVPLGTAWGIDARYNFTGLRQDVELAISEQAFFSSDRLAIRATARVGFGFTDPTQAIVRLQLYTPGGE